MTDPSIIMCRHLLGQIAKDVKDHFPTVRVIKDAWVWHAGRSHWEFHGPALKDGDSEFYWHGRAGNAYDARYKGWCAWLLAKGIDLDADIDAEQAEAEVATDKGL
jgi:hypothetical protein